jgi:hypothetical protein
VNSHPGDVTSSYRSALAKVERLERTPESGRGRARAVHFWAYDAGEDRLVRGSIPIWLLRRIANHEMDGEIDLGGGASSRNFKIDDLLLRPPGLLVEAVKEEDRVLIWLQ